MSLVGNTLTSNIMSKYVLLGTAALYIIVLRSFFVRNCYMITCPVEKIFGFHIDRLAGPILSWRIYLASTLTASVQPLWTHSVGDQAPQEWYLGAQEWYLG